MASFIIVTGTDPASRLGGIGFALQGYLRALEVMGVDWLSIPTYHPAESGGRWRPWLAAFPRLAREIRAVRRQGKVVIVYSHAGAGASLMREFFILTWSRLMGARSLMQLHALELDEYLGHPVQRYLLRLALSPAQALGVLTPWWQGRLAAEGVRKPIFVIPNPLPEEWEARARLPLPGTMSRDKINLFSLTRLVPGKGVDEVIEAMPLLPDEFEMIVAGDGPLRKKLTARVQQLGLVQRVRFTAWVAGEDKQRLFETADVFVLPSRYDSFGMGFLEAMANGLPVVAAEWGAIPDVVPNGRCGILVRKADPEFLIDAILALRDQKVRHRMGAEAKRWVLEKFSAEIVGRQLYSVFQALAK